MGGDESAAAILAVPEIAERAVGVEDNALGRNHPLVTYRTMRQPTGLRDRLE